MEPYISCFHYIWLRNMGRGNTLCRPFKVTIRKKSSECIRTPNDPDQDLLFDDTCLFYSNYWFCKRPENAAIILHKCECWSCHCFLHMHRKSFLTFIAETFECTADPHQMTLSIQLILHTEWIIRLCLNYKSSFKLYMSFNIPLSESKNKTNYNVC